MATACWWSRVRAALPVLCWISASATAQELQPRAYLPSPVGLGFFGISVGDNRGGLLLDPSILVQDVRATATISSVSVGQVVRVLGRTTQVLAVVPYVTANVSGRTGEGLQQVDRSGLGDLVIRYSMNLYGAPAMNRKEFGAFRQKTIVGASVTASMPTGQYDPARLINLGTNRWAFKPEIGISRAAGKWTFEGALGVWLYTPNNRFSGYSVRRQAPLGSVQAHVVRFFPHRIWMSGDTTFYTGGRTQVDGRDQATYQGNLRWGATFGIAVTARQAIRVSYFSGLVTRVGTDIRSVAVSYNYIWLPGK